MATIRCTDGKTSKEVRIRTLPLYARLAITNVRSGTIVLEDIEKNWYEVYENEPSLAWLIDECKKVLST